MQQSYIHYPVMIAVPEDRHLGWIGIIFSVSVFSDGYFFARPFEFVPEFAFFKRGKTIVRMAHLK